MIYEVDALPACSLTMPFQLLRMPREVRSHLPEAEGQDEGSHFLDASHSRKETPIPQAGDGYK